MRMGERKQKRWFVGWVAVGGGGGNLGTSSKEIDFTTRNFEVISSS